MKQIHVAAAVIEKDNKIFAAQRKDAGELALKWEFPGGKLEEGESGAQAIVREIREELSVDIVVKGHFLRVSHQYESFHITMDAYLCKLTRGDIRLNEHVDSFWCPVEQLMDLDWAAADIPIAQKLHSTAMER
ncbi:MAG: (deoxy)nucleoside triphosphate pyrophosphohydrolase [Sphaerochaetaceae bacterium]|nr:(deoxy)nucleoside triphosphate pyrophosphohydrolase [Sphaerochaetaceae bacterium]